jgi:enamine deaminase RidA (YjgF/YER057c/UK114 family)
MLAMHTLPACFLSSLALLLGQASLASAQHVQRDTPPVPGSPPAYRQVVTAKPGTMVWVSGQIAQNEKGELVGRGDVKAQADQVWENVRRALAAGGATFKDVVKVTTYVVNYQPSMRDDLRAARLRAMGADTPPPAATLVGVQSLASEDWLIEIEAVAVVP